MQTSTQKIYYEDIHIINFTATVWECIFDEQTKQYQIVLDRTAFFPEEGGQAADKGTIEVADSTSGFESTSPKSIQQNVLDVQIQGDVIYHLMAAPIPIGSTVIGHVDWAQRFDFMQQHSGEHIISGLIHSRFGLDNVGFHLGLSEVTLDMNGELTLEQLREIEAEANRVIWHNLPIWISYPDAEELASMDYRSKIELTENVRIVEIPGVDLCACCAPHVEYTGQIGLIKITGLMRHRGGVRITILCGERALNDYTQKQDSVTDISVALSARQNAVSEAVNRLKEDNLRLKEQYVALQAKLLAAALKALPAPDQSKHALLFVEDINDITMRSAINDLVTKYSGYCGIFVGNDIANYRFIIGSASHDCRELAGKLREAFQAKGGGTAPMIQGSIQATQNSIETFMNQL